MSPAEAIHLPDLSDAWPRRRNAALQAFGCRLLAQMGWRFEGTLPPVPKMVVAVAPHTSNWDFVVGGVGAVFALDLEVRFIGKHTLFRPPLGWLMRSLGGLPVERDARGGLVAQLAQAFREHDKLVLGIAPEGTRSAVSTWRTGFYHIAHTAGVPIVGGSLDYATKTIGLSDPLYPTGDVQADLEGLKAFFAHATGKNPQ